MICVNTILLPVTRCLTTLFYFFYLILLILLYHDLINFDSIKILLYTILKLSFMDPEVIVYKNDKSFEVLD